MCLADRFLFATVVEELDIDVGGNASARQGAVVHGVRDVEDDLADVAFGFIAVGCPGEERARVLEMDAVGREDLLERESAAGFGGVALIRGLLGWRRRLCAVPWQARWRRGAVVGGLGQGEIQGEGER